MNKRTRTLLIDWLLAVIIAVGLGYLFAKIPYVTGIFTISLIWLALRHGTSTGITAGFVAGALLEYIIQQPENWLDTIVYGSFPLIFVGLAGLFARNTQRTLNNRRLSSTYLNITTASLIVNFIWYLLRWWLLPMLFNVDTLLPIKGRAFWLSLIISIVVISLVLCLMARAKPESMIPKRTKFLSRRETSSLLND